MIHPKRHSVAFTHGPQPPSRDISELPEATREVLLRGVYGAGGRWTIFDQFVEADPGRKLRFLRDLRGLSQSELSVMAAVTQKDVSVAERDFDNMKIETLRKIVAALGVSLHELLYQPHPQFNINAGAPSDPPQVHAHEGEA